MTAARAAGGRPAQRQRDATGSRAATRVPGSRRSPRSRSRQGADCRTADRGVEPQVACGAVCRPAR